MYFVIKQNSPWRQIRYFAQYLSLQLYTWQTLQNSVFIWNLFDDFCHGLSTFTPVGSSQKLRCRTCYCCFWPSWCNLCLPKMHPSYKERKIKLLYFFCCFSVELRYNLNHREPQHLKCHSYFAALTTHNIKWPQP